MGFQQGLSGLNAASKNLEVIGNNVANANTVGYKQSQAQFADVYANSLAGGGGVQIGIGTKVSAVTQQFTQGNVSVTNNPLDVAINGSGFYRLDNNGTVTFSRNGQFQLDRNGFIVNSQGHKLTGYPVNAAGIVVPTTPGPLQISTAALMPQATVNVTTGLNLDARAAAPATALFNPLDPTSYNNSTSTTIYDSLGNAHLSTMYFQRQPIAPTTSAAAIPAGATTVTVASAAGLSVGNTITIAGAGVAGAPLKATITNIAGATLTYTPATSTATAAGTAVSSNAPSPNWNTYLTVDGISVPNPIAPLTTMTFNSSGTLTAPAAPVTSVSFTPAGGAAAQTLAINFAGTSQYGSAFGVNSMTQDGYTTGQLSGFSTNADGTIVGRYTNGQTKALGQVVLTNFVNAQGLQPMGNNEWSDTVASGAPLVGTPGTSGLGVLQSSAVEDSNVDLTAELVNMITAQRVYQANAQTIKTQDQALQTLVNLR